DVIVAGRLLLANQDGCDPGAGARSVRRGKQIEVGDYLLLDINVSETRDVALPRIEVGNKAKLGDAKAFAQSFIVAEIEEPVPAYRAAGRRPELVALEWRNFRSRIVEVVLGVKRRVSQKLV